MSQVELGTTCDTNCHVSGGAGHNMRDKLPCLRWSWAQHATQTAMSQVELGTTCDTKVSRVKGRQQFRQLSRTLAESGMHNQVSFYVAARIPEICAFNNIAIRLKSGVRSWINVRLRCAYRP